MPDSRPLKSKLQTLTSAVQSASETENNTQNIMYLARVIESGETAINKFQKQLGFRPPDGTIRAKIPNLHYTQKEEECPLFYPLFPPEFVMTPAKDQVVLVMFQTLATSGDVGGNGYWIREAIRSAPATITSGSADSARFDFGTVATQTDQFGNRLDENTKDATNYKDKDFEQST